MFKREERKHRFLWLLKAICKNIKYQLNYMCRFYPGRCPTKTIVWVFHIMWYKNKRKCCILLRPSTNKCWQDVKTQRYNIVISLKVIA